ncbi:unnamed protein product, partial [Scytosiphon promiscuus]
ASPQFFREDAHRLLPSCKERGVVRTGPHQKSRTRPRPLVTAVRTLYAGKRATVVQGSKAAVRLIAALFFVICASEPRRGELVEKCRTFRIPHPQLPKSFVLGSGDTDVDV